MIRRLRGPNAGDVTDIERDLLIGRTDADIELQDREVSRRHAVVRPVPDGVEIEDLGSSNGTFLDGRRIQGKLTVAQNATLRVGATELRIEVELPEVTRPRLAGAPQPDVTAQRPMARPEVTVARQVRPPPPPQPPPAGGAPPPAGEAPPPAGGAPPPAGEALPAGAGPPPAGDKPAKAPRGGRPAWRRAMPFVLGGLVGAAVAVAIVLLLGSSSKKTTTGAAVKPHCPHHFPPVIHDGFPEPKMIFSHAGALNTSLRITLANVTQDGVTYNTGMEYNRQLPGPTLVFCPGDLVTLHLFNKLPLPTNLHVHGLHVSPNGNGDNIFIDVAPLTEHTYQYRIPLDQFPGYYWYHPHFHPFVDPEEAGGAAGAIIVEGSLDDRLPNIPQRIMVIQGGNRRGPSQKGAAAGIATPGSKPSLGPPKPGAPPPPVGVPALMVNGVVNPTVHIRPGQLQRWRILNATSDRLLRLAMPGVTFDVLAQDGITLRDMRPERVVLVSPGSRVEVLVRGGKTGLYTLSALPFHQCLKGCNPFAGPATGVTTPKETLLSMISTGTRVHDQLPTGPIGNPPDLRNAHVDVHRTILFTQGPANPKKGPPPFFVNHQTFNPSHVDITMKLGSVEEWTLKNPTQGKALEWHTFHIHQNPFQIISINGKPLRYIDWQDNVTLPPNTTIVIRMKPIDFTGKFVFHCHVIFHEDHGMMGVVQVVKNPTTAQVDAHRVLYLVPPTGHQLYASLATASSSLQGFLYYCGPFPAARPGT